MDNTLIKCGLGTLSGVDRIKVELGWNGSSDGYLFAINGRLYKIYENPDDGYRSYTEVEDVTVGNLVCKNVFPSQSVLITFTKNEYGVEVYTLYNVDNGEIILRFGTDHTDSYYPMAIFEFYPENMSININKNNNLIYDLKELKRDFVHICRDFIKKHNTKEISAIEFYIDDLEAVNDLSEEELNDIMYVNFEVEINNQNFKIE